MLVLSRQRDESIVIEYEPKKFVIVSIVDIRGDKVRLGVDAPSEVPVHRREVYEAIQRENLRAGQPEPKKSGGLEKASLTPISLCTIQTTPVEPEEDLCQQFYNYFNSGDFFEASKIVEQDPKLDIVYDDLRALTIRLGKEVEKYRGKK